MVVHAGGDDATIFVTRAFFARQYAAFDKRDKFGARCLTAGPVGPRCRFADLFEFRRVDSVEAVILFIYGQRVAVPNNDDRSIDGSRWKPSRQAEPFGKKPHNSEREKQ